MHGMGTIVNCAAILLGGSVGLLFGSLIPERMRGTLMHALGLAAFSIGLGGFITQSQHAGGFLDGLINEMIAPGLADFVLILLLIQSDGGLQTLLLQQVGAVPILAQLVENVDVVVVQLGSGKLMAAEFHSGGGPLGQAAGSIPVVGDQADADAEHQSNHGNEHDGVALELLGLLLLCLLTLSELRQVLLLAERRDEFSILFCSQEVLFSAFHTQQSSSVWSSRPDARRRENFLHR